MELTEPLEVPVVLAAQMAEAVGPKRTSLPSMFPPGEVAVTVWSAPAASRRGLPLTSNRTVNRVAASQMLNMMANTA